MTKLLKYEFRKLVRAKLPYIFFAIQFFMLFLNAFMNKLMYDMLDPEMAAMLGNIPVGGVEFMLVAMNAGGMTTIILGLFVAIFCMEDRSNDTLKNILARGYTHTEVLVAELICITVYCFLFVVFTWLAGFALGAAVFAKAGMLEGKAFLLLFGQLVCTLMYVGLFFMFTKLVNKIGAAIALNIAVPVGVELVFAVLNIAMDKIDFSPAKYSPGGTLATFSNLSSGNVDIIVAFVVAIAYTAIFTVVAFLINRKRSA